MNDEVPAADGAAVPDGSSDDGERAARRTILLMGAAIVAGVLAVIVLVWPDGGAGDGASGATVASVGPAPGVPLAPYVEARRAALVEADGTRVAVVSFAAYQTTESVTGLVDDPTGERAPDIAVLGTLVALPGGGPTLVGDVADARQAARAEAEAQIAALDELIPTVDDPEFAEFYRAEVERYRAVAAAAEEPAVVFALVVRGSVAALRGIASVPGVRLVDLADGSDLVADPVVRGLRPEEAATAGEPRFRPL